MPSSSVFLTILVTIWGCSEAGLINYANLRYRRMSGGNIAGSPCDYPGAVALTSGTSVVCMGAQKAGKVIVPSDCAKQLKTINANVALTVRGGDSTGTASIAKGTITVTDNGNGTSTIAPLATPLPLGSCTSVDYTLYSATNTIDLASCTAVSYGSANMSTAKYDSTLDIAPLVSSSLLSCGTAVVANVASKTSKLLGVVPTALYSTGKVTITATTSAAFCRGDVGAPIYCTDTASAGSKVLVGLVASSSCTAGETFLSYDLTGGTLTGFSLAA